MGYQGQHVDKEEYSNSEASDDHQSHNKWQPFDDEVRCPPSSYQDFRKMEMPEQMDNLLNGGVKSPVLFDL